MNKYVCKIHQPEINLALSGLITTAKNVQYFRSSLEP